MHIKYFNKYLQDIKNDSKKLKYEFTLERTTHSRKIITEENDKIIFNKDGKPDNKAMRLINLVREDAQDYLNFGGRIGTSDIEYSELYKPIPKGVVCKIDFKSAYWAYALQRGIISVKTDELYKDLYEGVDVKTVKEKRLRALGSLATKKRVISYKWGKINKDVEEQLIFNKERRDLYLDICRGIDEAMRDIANQFPSVFFNYWDCIFAPEEVSQEVIEYIKYKMFDVGVTETRITCETIGTNKYLLSQADNKMYLVDREQHHLLKGL